MNYSSSTSFASRNKPNECHWKHPVVSSWRSNNWGSLEHCRVSLGNNDIKLWHVLRMSHAVGISLICSCQLPLSRLNGISAATEHLFNVRIVLRTFRDSIFEALDASPSTASVELKEAIDNLSFGRPGEFLYYNRYESESFISGRVTP